MYSRSLPMCPYSFIDDSVYYTMLGVALPIGCYSYGLFRSRVRPISRERVATDDFPLFAVPFFCTSYKSFWPDYRRFEAFALAYVLERLSEMLRKFDIYLSRIVHTSRNFFFNFAIPQHYFKNDLYL